MEKKLVSILLPLTWEHVSKHFMLALVGLVRSGERAGFECNLILSSQGYTDDNRDLLTKIALKQGAEYLFHIDADQTYPAPSISKLITWLEANDEDVIGGITPIRTNPNMPLTFKFGDESIGEKYWVPVNTPVMTGVQKVDGMGFGGIMTTARVYDKIGGYPWFKRMGKEVDTYGNQQLGEDVTFYKKCRDAGVAVWCDTDLRNGHVMTGVFMLEAPRA